MISYKKNVKIKHTKCDKCHYICSYKHGRNKEDLYDLSIEANGCSSIGLGITDMFWCGDRLNWNHAFQHSYSQSPSNVLSNLKLLSSKAFYNTVKEYFKRKGLI